LRKDKDNNTRSTK